MEFAPIVPWRSRRSLAPRSRPYLARLLASRRGLLAAGILPPQKKPNPRLPTATGDLVGFLRGRRPTQTVSMLVVVRNVGASFFGAVRGLLTPFPSTVVGGDCWCDFSTIPRGSREALGAGPTDALGSLGEEELCWIALACLRDRGAKSPTRNESLTPLHPCERGECLGVSSWSALSCASFRSWAYERAGLNGGKRSLGVLAGGCGALGRLAVVVEGELSPTSSQPRRRR